MAILTMNALSVALSGSFSATVILPDTLPEGPRPALYFIHAVGGSGSDIREIRDLQALSNELGLFIICPSLMHSFGLDLPWGGKYGDFVSRELPAICRHLFPLDEKRQYVGGAGGGAYGALWHGVYHGDVFSKCITFNARLDVASLCEAVDKGATVPNLRKPNLTALFGEDLNAVRGSNFDLFRAEAPVPQALYLGCEEDFTGLDGLAAYGKNHGTDVRVAPTREALWAAGLRWLCKE